MANSYYNASGAPSQGSAGSSATIRGEFNAIVAGFDKLPALGGNGGQAVFINAGATGMESNAALSVSGSTVTVTGDLAVTGSLALTSVTLSANLTVNGNTTLGNAAGDTLTIAPNAVTWSNNPTHSGNHTFSGRLLAADGTIGSPSVAFSGATGIGFSRSGTVLNLSLGGVNEARFDPVNGLFIGDIAAGAYTRISRTGDFAQVSTGVSVMQFDGLPADGTSAVTYQFGRLTTTTGTHQLQLLRGDGTTTVDHRLTGASTGVVAEFGRNGGRVIVGLADDGTNTFQVNGSAAVLSSASTTMLTLTNTNAGIGGVQVDTYANPASPANGDDLFKHTVYGNDAGGSQIAYAAWLVEAGSTGIGATQASVTLSARRGGSLDPILSIVNGTVAFPSVGTTASAANAFLDIAASPVNRLLRSTSSARYKTDIVDLVDDDALAVVSQMRPITYRSAIETDDQSRRWLVFIAEELAVIDPHLVHFTKDANGADIPDGVQYERVTVLLVAALQEALRRLDAGGL